MNKMVIDEETKETVARINETVPEITLTNVLR
ncbi:hypothetical protein L195_g063195, partial [Trifolium pratense]